MKRLLVVRASNEPSGPYLKAEGRGSERKEVKDSNCQKTGDGRQSLGRLCRPQSASLNEQNAQADPPIDVK